ncbi:transmembrane and coiled-coil domain-containing protein 4-like [Pistacia vera]|uniref:transmembrane and coiled-coil domain-containing protein 4-like n=1 Tax=Pistacia vera TaxID=55513 RepID=UPI0012633818|nr:transmembrane and coiled-coil domain-containing protein 4-like [Pistacia vera]
METSTKTPTQKYAAAGLFALALHHTQIHQKRPSNPLVPLIDEPIGEGVEIGWTVSVSDHPQLWIHENSGLLSPVFRFLGVDEQRQHGIKETAELSSQLRHHVGAFLTLLSAESGGTSEITNKELALTKTVDAMVLSMESSAASLDGSGNYEYENKCHEKYSINKPEPATDIKETIQGAIPKASTEEKAQSRFVIEISEQPPEEETVLTYQTKVAVLFELLSAFLVENTDFDKNCARRKGYDARHRVALRLLSKWLNVKWIKVEAIETIVASSLMATEQEQGGNEDGNGTSEAPGANWKRGGIIGAAALTGGTLMAITGGLAAPAIAHGLGSLAPTLGGLVPAIGASGFAAAASATGSAAGSAAVAASFGAAGAGLTGSKMAKRVGSIEEFEFRAMGENHNQGRLAVGIMISGFVFEEEDFIKPWEGHKDNLERYALWWESKNLIELSTGIQDWLTSRIAAEMMKQGAMHTVLNTLVAAFAMPATLVTASDLIDSKWAVAIDRSDKAGKLLAEVLLKGLQGNRPVTLIGFSLGARVIFKCLQCLAETGENAGLVERVVFLGAPISIEDENWEDARKMVAGRFVNAYSTTDWTLGIVFRASLLSKGLAGIQPVDISGIENVDVTDLIEGHSSYLWMTRKILEQLDLENYYPVFRTTRAKSQEQNSSVTGVVSPI